MSRAADDGLPWYQPATSLPEVEAASPDCLEGQTKKMDADMFLELADCHRNRGKWQAEILMLRALVQSEPALEPRWRTWTRMATRLEQLEHEVGAAKTWLAAARAEPQHPEARVALRRGICLARAADLPKDLAWGIERITQAPFAERRPSADELARRCAAPPSP